jgi:DNA-binding beta-propeller fold protein YncE
LYVAYRLSPHGSGSIEEFAAGSSQGSILGMSINEPQSVVVDSSGTILTVETGGTNRIDVFPPGYQTPTLEVDVRDAPTQIAISRNQHSLWVSSFAKGRIFSSPYPLLNPNGSPNVLHEKIRVKSYGSVQGMALSDGQVF